MRNVAVVVELKLADVVVVGTFVLSGVTFIDIDPVDRSCFFRAKRSIPVSGSIKFDVGPLDVSEASARLTGMILLILKLIWVELPFLEKLSDTTFGISLVSTGEMFVSTTDLKYSVCPEELLSELLEK